MLMEGRKSQQSCIANGKEICSPKQNKFQTKFVMLAARAKEIQNAPLKTLAHLIDQNWLHESWRRLRKGAAAGIDAVHANTYAEDIDNNLQNLLTKLKTKRYYPSPVRRVYIPKADGKQRPLGLPTVEDKIAQNAVTFLLTAIYEQDFLPMSYGFRPNRNAHHALEEVKATIAQKKVSWVLDVDIKSFFDSIDHEWLLKFIKHRIADHAIINLIDQWLKAGVMEDGKLIKSSSGSPQGGVISPILANIYLHYVIDLWVTKIVKKHLRGEIYSFRYADDVLFCFQLRNDAIRFKEVLKKRLAKFKLKLNDGKTKLCRFGKFAKRDYGLRKERRATFNFLGFTFYNRMSRNGKYTVGTRTQSKRLSGAMNRVTAWCKENRH
jgi:RNA-directed DNA polymerase